MKKAITMLLGLAACLSLGWSQEVKIGDNTPFAYAYLESSGPYTGMGNKIGELMQEAGKQSLSFEGGPFGLYLNSPQDVKSPAELKWLVGIPVGAKTPVAAPLKKGEYGYTLVARCLHTGPYEGIAKTYEKAFAFIASNGYVPAGPIMEQYLNDPMTTPAAALQTEVIIPVAKR